MTQKYDRSFKLSPRLTLGEMLRSQTAERRQINNDIADEEHLKNMIALANAIFEPIRSHYNVPIIPNSGYRSPQLNEAIGGSQNSQHSTGEAIDLEVAGVSTYDLAKWVEENLNFDQLILEGWYPGESSGHDGWVHISYKRNGPQRGQVLTWNRRDGFMTGLRK